MPSPLRRILLVLAIVAAAAASGCGSSAHGAAAGAGHGTIVLATTTSTQDSGLLDVLVPAFERASGYRVKTIAVGSGQALEMGRRGEADVVLAHSPTDEQALMATGVAGTRRLVMHNDFVLLGPRADPAHVAGRDVVDAFKAVATTRAPFISRGDDSGTNKFELKLWTKAAITPKGPWYQQSGQGMGATIAIAAQKRAYTLSDRATYLATKAKDGLALLVQGDPGLLNVYHVIDITRRAGSRVDVAGGKAFADWIVSAPAQRLIGAFGQAKYHQRLFVPDAGKADAEVLKGA
jgi:tungstate transport system substrate-binding protein